jgi:hypothetical protein
MTHNVQPLETQTVLIQRLRAADRRAPGQGWVNAGELAAQLDVTRNAIHQAAHRLRLAGWRIRTRSRTEGGLSYGLCTPAPPPATAGSAGVRQRPGQPQLPVLPDMDALVAHVHQLRLAGATSEQLATELTDDFGLSLHEVTAVLTAYRQAHQVDPARN